MAKRGKMCVAYGCMNRQGESSSETKITFHKFPKDEELRKKWAMALRRENWFPSEHSCICSKHFVEDDFDRSSPFKTFIKKGRIPSVFPKFPAYFQKPVKKERRQLKRKQEVSEELPEKIQILSEPEPDAVSKDVALQMTQRSLKAAKLRIHNLRRKNRRLTRKVANLKEILKDLEQKNFIQAEYCEMLNNISKTSLCLISRESRKNVSPKLSVKYDERLRNFAITLHFLSPKAYDFVRSSFQTALPHPKTISKWFSSLNAEPGFCAEVFKTLKVKSESNPNLICSLMFDSMAIRTKIDWDGNKLYGYMDLGMGNNDDSSPIANEVFVIHLVCINSLWKIPLGYFFIKGLSSEQIQSLLSQCLQLLSEINIRVVSVTCDGTSSNLSSAVKFGCNFKDPDNLVTSLNHGKHHLHFFLDPCHMLKLVRNTLHDLKILYDSEGRKISWAYLENLVLLQEKEGLHLGNKVTRRHVHYENQKMKVSLAAQLFSRSVADAIEYCRINNIEGFKECEGTINFIKIFNDIFDIFNSRNFNEKSNLKKPINLGNETEIFNILDRASVYIKGLKVENGKNILSSPRKTGFLGFLICINSLKDMYKKLVREENVIKYIPVYKTSQDHLERLFGYIRSRGGYNNNPSALEFKHIFKKIIVHKQLHESSANSGNSIPLDKINLLGISCYKPEENINLSMERTAMLDDINKENAEMEDDIFTEFECSDIKSDIIQYIAGNACSGLHAKV